MLFKKTKLMLTTPQRTLEITTMGGSSTDLGESGCCEPASGLNSIHTGSLFVTRENSVEDVSLELGPGKLGRICLSGEKKGKKVRKNTNK